MTNILIKEELDTIIKLYKNNKSYSQIGKELKRSPINIKNEINKYIKHLNHSGTSIYKLSKDFDMPLEKIKKIIDDTKLNETEYLEKEKMERMIELLKSKKKYGEVAKNLDTTKDTIILYFKRNIKEQIDSGVKKEELTKMYGLKNDQMDKLIGNKLVGDKKITKKKSELELLKEENNKLKMEIKKLKELFKSQ